MNKEEKETTYDSSELIKDYLKSKGYTRALENFEIEDKQKSKNKVFIIINILRIQMKKNYINLANF